MVDTSESVFARPFIERRFCNDRRNYSWRTFYHGVSEARRRDVRREDEEVAPHLDCYEPGLLLVALVILLLSLLDAILTLSLLPRGAIEWNPLMRYLIETDVSVFILLKTFVTGFGLVCLIALGRFRLFNLLSLHHILGGILIAYGMLITYEMTLLLNY